MSCPHPSPLIKNYDGTYTCRRCWHRLKRLPKDKIIVEKGYKLIFKNEKGKWYTPAISSKGNDYYDKGNEYLHWEGIRLKHLHSYIKAFRVVKI